MSRFALFAAASAFALSGCNSGGGNEGANAANAMPTTENGQLTVRAQGVDLKVNLPPPIRRMTEGNDYLYPGARAERADGDRRFHSDDSPDRVAAWYQDSARSRLTIASVERQGPAFVLSGAARNGDALRIRLFPSAQGGTDGTIAVTARN